ncbi:MAG TPA: hypothetical protein DCY91_06085 [Cyanobacteria bacterium UBA11370]|nr:hypothetical protein [Cyanobacteria bacterium UBA11370]
MLATNNQQQTTNNKQPTTNNQQTTNNKQPTTNKNYAQSKIHTRSHSVGQKYQENYRSHAPSGGG